MRTIPTPTTAALGASAWFAAQAGAGVITLSDSTNRVIADNDPAPPALVTLDAPPSPGASVESVTVDLSIAHPWVGDLTVILRHAGQEATLLDRFSSDVFPFGCGGDDVDARFTDAAASGPEGMCSASVEPTLSGELLPQEPLSVFNGADPGGAWELVVIDSALYDVGALVGVTLTIGVAASCPADLDGDGTVGSADLAVMLGAWGQSGGPADFNGDGVDSSDLAQLLGAWGDCP